MEKKTCSAGRSAQAQTSCRRRGMVDGPLRQSGTETRYPWGNHQPGEVRDTSCAAFRCRSPGSSGKPGDLPVGAVINRPGDSAGVPAGQCAPHSLFGCAKKRTRRARCKRKRRRARSGAVALRAQRGSAYRCLLRFGLAFGHAMLFCDSCCCRPVADGADLVGVVVAWSCFSFRYRSRSREESGSA